MRIKSVVLVVLSIGLFSGGVVSANDGPQAAMKEFVAAFNSQDAAGVSALFHDDGKLLPDGQPMVSGIKAIEEFWAGAFGAGLSAIEKTPIEIVVSGDLAVETSSYFITFGDARLAGKDTLVWRKDADGEWKISTDIWAMDQE
jgi:uncharacterized protein (TIGR02246 family)